MKKDVFIIVLSLFIILTIVSFLYDSFIIRGVSALRNSPLDYMLLGFTFLSNVVIIFFFLTTLFLWGENKRRWILPLWMTFLLSTLFSYILKIIIQRPRPFQKGLVTVLQITFHFMRNNFNTWNFSFPSLQAVVVFAAMPILSKEFKKFRYIWLIFACLVAFSRVYFGAHYLSDVLAGGVIGYILGYFVVISEEKYHYGKKIIEKIKK